MLSSSFSLMDRVVDCHHFDRTVGLQAMPRGTAARDRRWRPACAPPLRLYMLGPRTGTVTHLAGRHRLGFRYYYNEDTMLHAPAWSAAILRGTTRLAVAFLSFRPRVWGIEVGWPSSDRAIDSSHADSGSNSVGVLGSIEWFSAGTYSCVRWVGVATVYIFSSPGESLRWLLRGCR